MKAKKILFLLSISVLLAGCSWLPKWGNLSSSSEVSSESSESSSESHSSESSSSESQTSISSSSEEQSSSEESSSSEPQPLGYVKVDHMSFVNSDLDSAYAPAIGDVKMLVIPIAFQGNTGNGYSSQIQNWTSTKLSNMYGYYFGESNSLSSYYATASFGKMNLTGMVSDVYPNTTYTVKAILEDDSMDTLWDMMDEALAWVMDNNPSIDWSEYDLNEDGNIDNIHLITNYSSNKWAENLWPHMYYTRRSHSGEHLGINVYSISGLSFVNNSVTAIHEQGHIFGLQDYYDYSNDGQSPIDYIGGLDMQSHNVFDWNSFSKLSTGWVEPYVVTGEAETTTITLNSASLTGDCIIIPADYSTWNGSAFDEYFLVELFTKYGNNVKDWSKYSGALGAGGVRLYHVDARAYGSNQRVSYNNQLLVVDDMEEQEINSVEDVSKWNYTTLGANNCSDWRDYEGGIEQLANHPLLSIVQRGGDFTFAKNNNDHKTLNATDLFKNGHKFTFEEYSHFLNKDRTSSSTMDNGEIFPYEISFSNFSQEHITVTITKVR